MGKTVPLTSHRRHPRPTREILLRLPVAVLAVLLTACGAHGQAPVPPAPVAPAISVNADEVSLDLLVHDEKGRPVLDLQPSQIAVTDGGTPVKLTNLRLIKDDPANGRKVTLVFGRLDSAGDKNARDIAPKIINAIPEGSSFAVLNVGSRLRLLHAFTSDRAEVDKAVALATVQDKPGDPGNSAGPEKDLQAVAQTGADASGNSVPATNRALAKMLLAGLMESQRIVQDQNSQPTLAGLLALARTQREIAGRKVVIYFTQGFQMDSNAVDMVRSIVGEANRSGVTFYVVDLSALDEHFSNKLLASIVMAPAVGSLTAAAKAASGQGSAEPTSQGTFHEAIDQAGRIESEGLSGTSSPLGTLASNTGGAYIVGGDSLKKPLKRLVDDMTTYYEASFVPAITDYDGSFRPVQVTSLRKSVVLRYRAGYFALAPGSVSTVKPFEVPLLKILDAPQLPNDLQFRAGVLRMGQLPDGNVNTLVIEAPLTGLEVREDTNTRLYFLHLSIVAQIKNRAGTVIDHFSEDILRHGAIESLQATQAEVATLQRHFVAPPGDYVLETAILDHNSQKAGAQRINFEVPANPIGLGLSDMALVRRTDPFRLDADPLEPLRYGNAKVVPNLSGEVARDAKDISVFFIIHPDAGSDPVKLEMQVHKDGKSIGRMPLPVRSDTGAATAVPYLATIQARSLSPGHYEVAAVLSQGNKSTLRTIAFTIHGTELASAARSADGPKPAVQGSASDDSADDANLPSIAAASASKLVITSPADPVSAPPPGEIASIIDGARARALHYAESLPNFYCVEVTTRSLDSSGRGEWKHKDQMAQLLKYYDSIESRTMLEANGERSSIPPDGLKGMISHGQFGGVLSAVFQPAAKAEFQWKETDVLGSGKAQAFSYTVRQENSNYGLTGSNNSQINVAFHGLVYVDAATLGVRRITLEADGIPRDFSIHASSMAVDYDYIVINGHDYLMPIHAAVSIRQGRHEALLNEIEFRDYKRFGSRIRIVGITQPPAQ